MVMADDWDLSDVASEEEVFTLTDDSTMVSYEVVVLKDSEEFPVAYTSYITTPVCDDTLCALMHIQMYWNLLGNYIGYDTITSQPLTKNDHLKFRDEDYAKLHRLLMDDNSIIKRKEKKDLFDDNQMRVSEVVDAVTGATAKEVREAVVDGALYSSYTIYHIVYGAISDSIRSDMERKYDKSIQKKLLSSVHSDYQLYALKTLDPGEFLIHKARIIELIHDAIPLIRLYIMKKMPEEMWYDESIQNEITAMYGDLDVNSMSWVLKKIVSLDQLSTHAISNLAKNIHVMSRNQLRLFIQILEKKNNQPSFDVLNHMRDVLNKNALPYGYLLEAYLEGQNIGKVINN